MRDRGPCDDVSMDTQWTLNGHDNGHSMDTSKTHMICTRVCKEANSNLMCLIARIKHMFFTSAHRVSIVVSVERPIECPLSVHCISETGVHTVAHSACVQLVLLSW